MAGVVAVILLLSTTVTFVAATPPKLTVAPLRKFVPVIVTEVPPLLVPELGEMLLAVGAGLPKVNALFRVELCVSGLVTVTLTVPEALAGVVAVIVVLLTTATLVAAVVPNVTVAPA